MFLEKEMAVLKTHTVHAKKKQVEREWKIEGENNFPLY